MKLKICSKCEGVWTSVGWLLKCSLDSQLGSGNENQLTPSHVRIKLKINFRFSHEWKPVMKTGSNFIFGEPDRFSNRELISNPQNLCISCWLLLSFFSLRAATLLLLILPFSHYFYSFHVVAILLTWCCSFHMMK